MILVLAGMLLVIAGIAMAAVRTAERGQLSHPSTTDPTVHPHSLEPVGRGKRLGLKAGLPALGLATLGAALILVGSLTQG